ncbi:YfiR family protein [Pelomonas sp. Root1444]|uniref:YfiR family protein n=1 Tax=Pelomonas sp. Root1444 TaxID=1736464 RepID=UPI000702EC81|nr:YfiR family protein [Pelomonas sp. Root1444]KQY81027.1 hypothetical protein ASD35_04080 [Pelomonas sp. Root1444]
MQARRSLVTCWCAAPLQRWSTAGLLACAALGGANAGDNDGKPLGAQVKAAYLYKFIGHVDWPPGTFADATAPFTIGIVGAGDIADELGKLKPARAMNEHPVEVRVLKAGEAVRGVQLVFVGGADAAQLKRLLEPYKASPTLTISDVPGAMEAGCVINFVTVDNRIRFEISMANAERQGLKVSSRLLAVAQRVDTGRP